MLGIGAISRIVNLCFISLTPKIQRSRKNGRQNFPALRKNPVNDFSSEKKILHPFSLGPQKLCTHSTIPSLANQHPEKILENFCELSSNFLALEKFVGEGKREE